MLTSTAVALFLNGLLMLLMPVGLGFFLQKRFHPGWRLFWIGAITFVLSQLGHIPFNYFLSQLFARGILPMPVGAWQLVFNACILGLSAGIWEETFRYGAYRWWAKDARSWSKGLMLGAGHGGIEAIILGFLVLINFIAMILVQRMDLSTLVPPEQLSLAQQQVAAYWATPWYLSLIGAVERAFTIPFHLAASILVLQVFTRRNISWLWLAIAWHAILDATIVYIGQLYGSIAAEIFLGITVVINLGIIFALRTPELAQDEIVTERETPTLPPISIQNELSVAPESLDESRYFSDMETHE